MTDPARSGLNYTLPGFALPDAQTPPGFRTRERRVLLGSGDETWARGAAAVAGWAVKTALPFTVEPHDERVVLGRDYDTRLSLGPLRVREPVRVVWIADEAARRGFGYGTRPGHPLEGEECFLVERGADGTVWFVTRTVSRVSRGRWLLLWPGIRLLQPIFQRAYARAAVRLVREADAGLPGMRAMRHGLVGDEASRVDGIARFGYGMNPERGPFDSPPAEAVELDPDDLPWELRGDPGESSPPRMGA